MALNITGDARADQLLTDDPFALLVGMLLDQQVTMETAFAGPAKIADRMGYSQMHVSRLLKNTLEQLREDVGESAPDRG